MATWGEQWARMRRWYALLDETSNDYRTDKRGTDFYRDEMYAFFEASTHLVDWLGADSNSGVSRKEALEYLRKSEPLRVGASIAVGSKHVLIDDEKLERDARFQGNDVFVQVGIGVKHRFRLQAGGKVYDSLDLATECIDAWQAFLEAKKLLPATSRRRSGGRRAFGLGVAGQDPPKLHG